ncbi:MULTISPECIES: hypothetical protein [Streptomyces]|nr:hypothetical protein [Streptomyces sp. XM4011]
MGKHEKERPKCPVCNGTGKSSYSNDGTVVTINCTACGGSGKS